MKKNRKCAKQKPRSPGGQCRCSTDGGGYETLQSHYSYTAGGLNKPVCVCAGGQLCVGSCHSLCSSLYTVKPAS